MIKNSLEFKLKVKQFELQNVQNENERARILNYIAKIKNDNLERSGGVHHRPNMEVFTPRKN